MGCVSLAASFAATAMVQSLLRGRVQAQTRGRGTLLANCDVVVSMQARKTSLGARSDRRTKPQTNFKAVRRNRCVKKTDFTLDFHCPLGCHVLHFKHHTIFAMRDNEITRSVASRLFFSVSLPKELRGGPTMSRMSQ